MRNPMAVDLYNQTITGDVSKTLNNRATDSDHIPCVILLKTYTESRYGDYRETGESNTIRSCGASCVGGSEVIVLESNQNHSTAKDTEICSTLPASMGLGGGYVPMIVTERRFSNGRTGELISSIYGEEIAQTLDASYYKGPGARNGKEREVLAIGGDAMNSVVRRLTPLE